MSNPSDAIEAYYQMAHKANQEATDLRAKLAAAEEEAADLNAIFDLRHAADVRAIQRWREGHPERALILPDQADLCVWLLEQLQAVERDRDVWHLAHDLIINTDVEAQRAQAFEEKLAAAEQQIRGISELTDTERTAFKRQITAAEQRAERAEGLVRELVAALTEIEKVSGTVDDYTDAVSLRIAAAAVAKAWGEGAENDSSAK